jgi:LacI family transcriptional regulator
MTDPAHSRRPTMKDVADRVGISVKSVSRVLNGEGGVSLSTSEQIHAVAHELGYRRNHLARSLRRRDRTETIGIVTKHASTRFFEGVIRGIDEVAAQHGALVLTATTRTADREQATLLALSYRRVDGLIIMPTGDDQSFLRAEQTAGLPLVFVDRPPRGITADTVIADNVGGAYTATAHLLTHRHRRIGLVGPQAWLFTVTERLTGHRTALAEVSIPLDEQLIRLDCDTPAAAQSATAELLNLSQPPTAIFGLNNQCTIGVARALRQTSLAHKIALVGFDDFEPADLLDPPLTTVAQDVEAIGRQAAQRLFSRLNGDHGPPQTTVMATHLIQRGSGEIRAGNGSI